MKEIQLTQGYVAIVDDDDFEYLIQYKWRVKIDKKRLNGIQYAIRSKRFGKITKHFLMHRDILNAPSDKLVDHINGNGLDNRKSNLRLCNNSENLRNKGKDAGTYKSKYKGVTKVSNTKNRWRAYITLDRKYKELGTYATEKEAAIAYNNAALIIYKEFAKLNDID